MAGETRQDRWQHLLAAAHAIREAQEPRLEAERWLDSIPEVFASDLDPVTEFEAYAVRRFVMAVGLVLRARP
jgi:hypothetical protein